MNFITDTFTEIRNMKVRKVRSYHYYQGRVFNQSIFLASVTRIWLWHDCVLSLNDLEDYDDHHKHREPSCGRSQVYLIILLLT